MPLIQASEPKEVYPALKTQLASVSASFMGFIGKRNQLWNREGHNTEMNGLMVLLQIADELLNMTFFYFIIGLFFVFFKWIGMEKMSVFFGGENDKKKMYKTPDFVFTITI